MIAFVGIVEGRATLYAGERALVGRGGDPPGVYRGYT